MTASTLPILIIGAGPVGLSLAAALNHKGIPAHVYEKLPELSPEARASTFHPRTLEMFAEWGAVDALLEHGYQVHALQYWERHQHELIATFDYGVLAHDTDYPFRLQCPQSVLTRILAPIVDQHPMGKVQMGWELRDFEDTGEGVIAHFNTPDGIQSVQGRFLCGADGAHSTVRQQLNLTFTGKTYPDRFLLVASDIDFKTIYPDLAPVSYIFDPVEWVIILQLPDVTRTVFRIQDHEDGDAIQQYEALCQRIRRFTGENVNFTIHKSSIYSVHQRVAERFRVGNVLLLGDSAHINNPMGGMGMNSGIHDAYHLAKAIEAVLQGHDDSVLDEYSEKRRQYAIAIIQEATDLNYRYMAEQDDAHRRARNQAFRDIVNNPQQMRNYLIKSSMLDDRIHLEGVL